VKQLDNDEVLGHDRSTTPLHIDMTAGMRPERN
jgi:hypothetical protein